MTLRYEERAPIDPPAPARSAPQLIQRTGFTELAGLAGLTGRKEVAWSICPSDCCSWEPSPH